jgi:hypothetical protein
MTISRDDPFYSAKARLQRAEDKISELDTTIWLYRDKHPPSVVCEPDEPDRRTKTYKFKFSVPFPDSWTHLAIEVLEATRSALDQCGFAAAKLSGNTRLKRTNFPFADSLTELENHITGRKACDDIPPVIIAVFKRFKPYKGGNDTLWGMNKLRNSNHTQLIPVGLRRANILIHHRELLSGQLIGLDPLFDSTKHELPFARAAIDENFEFSAYPAFEIGFEETEITGRRHAVAFLTAAVNEVEEIVEATEIACKRLGYIP